MSTRRNEQIERHLRAEANSALVKGGLYAALLGIVSGSAVAIALAAGLAKDLLLPVLFAFFASGVSGAIHLAAKAGKVDGWVAYALFIPFVSLPTFFFLGTHFLMPSGAATYITGPISYPYLLVVFVTGFLFRPRLSVVSGLVAGAGYLFVYFLARESLQQISAADPVVQQDLTAFPIYFIKALMIAFAGVFAAGLAVISKRLIVRVLEESQSREHVSRLFGQFVSEEVKEKLVNDKAGIVGERKDVAVLFSDLRGFSTWSEKTEPEQVVARLNEYFEAMVECIAAEGGVVDKFIGDAIMAVFGGVLPLENPSEAAVRAALRMRERLARLNDTWRARGLPPLENGIGLHYGSVLQGAIGSSQRKDFTVIGDTVNIASRTEGLTKDYPERVLVTEELMSRLGPELRGRCVAHGLVRVKGRTAEVAIYGVAA